MLYVSSKESCIPYYSWAVVNQLREGIGVSGAAHLVRKLLDAAFIAMQLLRVCKSRLTFRVIAVWCETVSVASCALDQRLCNAHV